jgi:hypothetical protein
VYPCAHVPLYDFFPISRFLPFQLRADFLVDLTSCFLYWRWGAAFHLVTFARWGFVVPAVGCSFFIHVFSLYPSGVVALSIKAMCLSFPYKLLLTLRSVS